MKRVFENLQIFIIGAILYCSIEILFRGYTHWTMFLAGGLCLVILYHAFLRYKELSLFKKCLLGALIITFVEFIFGCVFNLFFNWNVWDYSHFRFNFMGQVCLLFTILWFFISIPVVLFINYLKQMVSKEINI
ncbi:MAG: hypothetical protein GX076_07630 [Clostridiales bacterium]|nr:hypothetical protein [Clostridiales bacterium]